MQYKVTAYKCTVNSIVDFEYAPIIVGIIRESNETLILCLEPVIEVAGEAEEQEESKEE